MEGLRENLDFLDEDLSSLQTRLQNELDDVQNRRLQERNKILRVMSIMKLTVQRAEDKFVAENDNLFSKFEDSLKTSLETTEDMRKEVSSIQSETGDDLTSGSEMMLRQKYDSLQDRYATLQRSSVAPVFKQVDDDLEVLKCMDFGYFEHVEYLSDGVSKAQTIKFSTQLKYETNPCFPTGFLWVNGLIILSDKGNKKLKFFSDKGEFLGELIFTMTSPYGVCHIKDDSFAVTLPKIREIYIVEFIDPAAKVLTSFKTYSGYSGLCRGPRTGSLIGTVASNSPGESRVDIIGLQGEIYLSFQNDPQLGVPLFKFPRYVVVNQGVLIISDWRKDSVIFLHETTGCVLKEYKGTREQPLVNPYDLSLDDAGNVYVLNGKDGSIHVLDTQCNLIEVLHATSELISPRLIAYDCFGGRLAVTYAAGDVKSYHHRVPTTLPIQPASPPPHSPSFLLPPKDDAHLRCPSPVF